MPARVHSHQFALLFAALVLTPALSRAQVGACCRPDGVCTVVPRQNCSFVFLGEGTTCAPNPCAGACCFPDGRCDLTFRASCGTDGGVFVGEGVGCGMTTCQGACCLEGGGCDVRTRNDCTAIGGIFLGYSTGCESAACPGACCDVHGSCRQVAAASCTRAGDVFLGVGTRCATSACVGACCLADGTCEPLARAACESRGGIFRGSGVECAAAACPPSTPTGACCTASGCVEVARAYCRGGFQGDGTQCGTEICQTGACCLPNELCLSATQNECTALQGTFLGADTECEGPRSICPGACDGELTGDCDADGRITNFDIDAFVLAVSNPPGYLALYPGTSEADRLCRADMNFDAMVNSFDIDGFVSCISDPPPPGQGCD